MSPRLRPAALAALLALFLLLGWVGILHHEMWRDELEIWLIAHASDSLSSLFHNMRTEGHPALWYLLVFAVTRLSDNPFAMQLLHLAIGAGSVAVVLRYAPFPILHRVLFGFGYYLFYEYTIISRSYGLEFLLVFAFCALYPRREQRLPWLALLLFLMANTNLYGAILAANLGLFTVVEARLAGGRVRYPRRGVVLSSLALFVAGLALGLTQIVQQSLSIGPAHAYHPLFNLEWLALSFPTIQDGYLPLPDFRTSSFWNTSILDALPLALGDAGGTALSVLLFGLSVWLLALRRSVLALFWLGALPMFCITLFVWFGQLRHHGQLFLLFVVCCWLAHQTRDGGEDRRLAARERFLAVLLAVQCLVGFYAYALDLRHPFSNAAATGRFLQQEPYADRVLIGSRDYAVQPIAAYVKRPIFYPENGKFGTFVDWGSNRRMTMTAAALHAAVALARQQGEPVLLILNVKPPDFTPGRELRLESDVHMRYVASFDGAIVNDENFVVIWVFPTGAP